MSYYDGDHPYLAEQRRLDEEEEQRKREQNEAWEQNQKRMREEWDRQLAEEKVSRNNNRRNNNYSDDSWSYSNYNDDDDSAGYSSNSYSGDSSTSSSSTTGVFGYIAIFVVRVIAVFIWLFFCEVVLDLSSNYVAFWIVLIPALIIEYIFGKSSNYIHMAIEILGYLFIFSQYVQEKQGFIQLYSMLPLASYFAGFFINKK